MRSPHARFMCKQQSIATLLGMKCNDCLGHLMFVASKYVGSIIIPEYVAESRLFRLHKVADAPKDAFFARTSVCLNQGGCRVERIPGCLEMAWLNKTNDPGAISDSNHFLQYNE